MRRRFVLPPEALGSPDSVLELPADIARHLEVLRLLPGAEIELTDGEGREAVAVLDALPSRKRARVRLRTVREVPAPALEIVLMQGVGKGDKLDQVVRQVGEIGATRLIPVVSERAMARADGRHARLLAIADDALRVARAAWRLRVDPPATLDAALGLEASVKLVFAVGAEQSLKAVLGAPRSRPGRVALLVGPEGGFSEDELARADAAGFVRVHVGDRILRTETAGPAVVAMVRFALALD